MTQKSLVMVIVLAVSLMIPAFIFMPEPYNYIVCIAIAGPLSAAVMGLKYERSRNAQTSPL